MRWVAVDSSAISALGYDARRGRLGIAFRDRPKNRNHGESGPQVYFYHHVSPEEFAAFLAAESKGRYLTGVFLPKNYTFTGPHRSRRAA